MQFDLAGQPYVWHENWTELPDSRTGWAHHGMARLDNYLPGESTLITGHSTRPELYFLNAAGDIRQQVNLPVAEIHHICPVQNGAEQSGSEQNDTAQTLLICDIGGKDLCDDYVSEPQVIEFDLTGKPLRYFARADFGYEAGQAFKPTCAAFDALNQRIWVADGYGSSKVHCLDINVALLSSLDGSEGAGRFDCPHTVFVDSRNPEQPKILIADRSNHRIQTYSCDGDFLGVLSIPELNTPSAFLILNELLLVVELEARIHVLDAEINLLQQLFDGRDYVSQPGWPNRLDKGVPVAPADLKPGKLNSPHSICMDEEHNIYISEWLIGDRFIKLDKQS